MSQDMIGKVKPLGTMQHNQGFIARAEIALPSLEDARKALEAHLKTCPGSYLECYGNRTLEHERSTYLGKKHHLEAILKMCEESERGGWRDTDGNRINPIPWTAERRCNLGAPTAKALECRRYRERKASGEPPPPRVYHHRPRSENPSKAALRKRRYREEARLAAEALKKLEQVS